MINKARYQAKTFLFDEQIEDSNIKNIKVVKLNSFLAHI